MKITVLKHAGISLLAVMLCQPLISCDGDDNPEIPSTGNYTVVMEIGCSVPNTCAGVANVEMAWPEPGTTDETESKIVEKGEKWAQTVIYEEIPEEPIGVLVIPRLADGIEEGTELTVDYTYSCKVSLMQDGKVVEHVSCETPVSDTFKYDPTVAYHLSERTIYTVTTAGIKKVDGSVDDDPDPGTENKKVDEELERVNGKIHCFSLNEDATDDNFWVMRKSPWKGLTKIS